MTRPIVEGGMKQGLVLALILASASAIVTPVVALAEPLGPAEGNIKSADDHENNADEAASRGRHGKEVRERQAGRNDLWKEFDEMNQGGEPSPSPTPRNGGWRDAGGGAVNVFAEGSRPLALLVPPPPPPPPQSLRDPNGRDTRRD